MHKDKESIIKKKLYIFCFLFLGIIPISNSVAQHKFKTVRDTTKYNERSFDVKIFRTFNNIKGSFVHSVINITNESLIPVGIGTPIVMYIAARINENHYDENSAVLLALSEVTNEILTQGLKKTIRRNRPFKTLNNVNYTDISKVKGTYSFPSGHASGSFAIATSLTLRYPDKPVLIAGLYAYALTVSLGRIYWGVHYPSDVFTGMLVGAGSAALIYSLRKPIIKAKNNLFNQSERTDNYQGEVNTTAILLSFAVSDLLNFYFTNSGSKILNNSNINLSPSGNLNYTFTF